MTTTTATPLEGAAPGDGAPIIETLGLTKTYSGTDFRAVDGLNLQVGSGEVFGLLGPNGAGKTTTIGVLTTRVIPTGGQALIGGIDVVQHPTLVKQLIGVVSQQNTLDRLLTPFENLYWHGRLFGMGAKESRQTADDLLERFQLTRFAKASVYALSGGILPRAKYTSSFGNESKADSGRPKFFASSGFGVCPIQSVIEKVPNSEK